MSDSLYEYKLKLLPEEEERLKGVADELRMTMKAVLLGGVELMAGHSQNDLAGNVAIAVVNELAARGMTAKVPQAAQIGSYFE